MGVLAIFKMGASRLNNALRSVTTGTLLLTDHLALLADIGFTEKQRVRPVVQD